MLILGILFLIAYLLGVFDETLYDKVKRKERERREMAEVWRLDEKMEE